MLIVSALRVTQSMISDSLELPSNSLLTVTPCVFFLCLLALASEMVCFYHMHHKSGPLQCSVLILVCVFTRNIRTTCCAVVCHASLLRAHQIWHFRRVFSHCYGPFAGFLSLFLVSSREQRQLWLCCLGSGL